MIYIVEGIFWVNNLDGGSTDNPLVNEIFREDEER